MKKSQLESKDYTRISGSNEKKKKREDRVWRGMEKRKESNEGTVLVADISWIATHAKKGEHKRCFWFVFSYLYFKVFAVRASKCMQPNPNKKHVKITNLNLKMLIDYTLFSISK